MPVLGNGRNDDRMMHRFALLIWFGAHTDELLAAQLRYDAHASS